MESLVVGKGKKEQQDHSNKGENCHSKKIEELDREQQILLKENKEAIIDLIIDNKDAIRVEDLNL